jgi:ABC-2 type transport system ATP-binding protein
MKNEVLGHSQVRDPNSALKTRGLTKRYGHIIALEDLTIDVPPGVVYGLLGPNGAGKSTALRLFLGLVRPTAGESRIFGYTAWSERLQGLRLVGASVEEPAFFLYLSAKRNLELLSDLTGGVLRNRVDEVLETVGLLPRAHDRVGNYSHGMKQRLAIAQTLLHRPPLIILDEPTAGLDPFGMVDVRQLIRQLAQQMGVTVVLSSHLLSEVQQVCDRVAILSHGKLVTEGAVADLLSNSEVIYSIHADPLEIAQEVVSCFSGINFLESRHGHIKVRMGAAEAGRLNRALVEQGVDVLALVPQEPTLEDIFLQLTKGESRGR